jgi:branched-chain amino acid transport system permease protein
MLLVALVALFGVAAMAPASAAGDAVIGTLTGPDGSPVAGVAITVSNAEGFSGSATSDAQGDFRVEIPAGGTYTIDIDLTTLPAGISLAKPEDATRELLVLGGEKKLLIPLVSGDGGGEDAGAAPGSGVSGQQVVQLLADGIMLGILIALGALGLNLVFGTTGLTNFAHGELITLGAFVALLFNTAGLHIVIAAPLSVIVCAVVFGWGQNKVLWKPLRKRKTGLIAAMIVSIGLAIVLRYTVSLFFGSGPRTYDQYAGQEGINIGPFATTPKQLILAAIAIVILAATVVWVQRSRIGKATRAVSDNPALASATGIDVERVIAVVWTVAAGLAAYAGIYLGMTQNSIWNMGQRILLVLFAAVILGGLGTVYGALVGALVVGVFIQLTTLVIPPEMKTVGALFLMILILLVRPQGLLGRRERVG